MKILYLPLVLLRHINTSQLVTHGCKILCTLDIRPVVYLIASKDKDLPTIRLYVHFHQNDLFSIQHYCPLWSLVRQDIRL